jgi:tetratricopeptide (TPR) repeat protein
LLYVVHSESWLASAGVPACLFDPLGLFTLAQCKPLGFGLDIWARLLGITLVGTLGFIYSTLLRRLVNKLFSETKRWRSKFRVRPATGGRISILLARLDGDDASQSVRESIRETIERELKDSVEIIAWPEVIKLREGNDLDARVEIFNSLQALLRNLSCDVAIWGRAKADDLVSLRFTVSEFGSRQPETYELTDSLELPREFIQSLGLAIAIRACAPDWNVPRQSDLVEFFRRSAQRLKVIIENDSNVFDPQIRASLILSYGKALLVVGKETNSASDLNSAVGAFKAALTIFTRDNWPQQWQLLSLDLALALTILGEQLGNSAALKESEGVLRKVLETIDPEKDLITWGAVSSDLGGVLYKLGEQQVGGAKLREAIAVLKLALSRCTREKVPFLWCPITVTLAFCLQSLGEIESGVSDIREAIERYLSALDVWTRDLTPQLWASTESSLGNAYRILGEREQSTTELEAAVAHTRNSLKERSRNREPMQWALSQNNLGISLLALGQTRSSVRIVRKAVAALELAASELVRDRSIPRWTMVQINLVHALLSLGYLSNKPTYLSRALAIADKAMKHTDPIGLPLHAAMLLNNSGNAKRVLGLQIDRIEYLEDAFESHSMALKLYELCGAEYYIRTTKTYLINCLQSLGANIVDPASLRLWLSTMGAIYSVRRGPEEAAFETSMERLGHVVADEETAREPELLALSRFYLAFGQRKIGELQGKLTLLEQAKQNLRLTLEQWTFDRSARLWGRANRELGNICVRIAEQNQDLDQITEGIDRLRTALRGQVRSSFPADWANTQVSLGVAYAKLSENVGGVWKIVNLWRSTHAYKRALRSITREEAPSLWALANNNAGANLLQTEQVIESTRVPSRWLLRLVLRPAKSAEGALSNALSIYTRETHPLEWAMAKTNLANVFLLVGQQTRDRRLLRKAIDLAREGMQEFTRESAGFQWAKCQVNPASALMLLGEFDRDANALDESISAFATVIEMSEAIGDEQLARRARDGVEETKRLLQEVKGRKGKTG